MAKENDKPKTPEQLLKEYDDSCDALSLAKKAVMDEERKPRTSPAHVAFAAARERKFRAAIAAQPQIDARNTRNEAKALDREGARQTEAQAKIDADFAAKGGVDVTKDEPR